jgi:hypothetical protein
MKNPKQPHLTKCPTCKGSGTVELEGALLETLSRFKTPKTRLSANDLHDPASGITKNAMNNRLEKLRKMDLLGRERAGRVWTYYKPDGEAPAAAQPAGEVTPEAPQPAAPKPNSRNRGDGRAADSAKRAKANAAKKGTGISAKGTRK